MVMLRLSSPDDVAALPKSKWGIPEPRLPEPFEKERDDGTYAGRVDLVLVPGVRVGGFRPRGMGMGSGCI